MVSTCFCAWWLVSMWTASAKLMHFHSVEKKSDVASPRGPDWVSKKALKQANHSLRLAMFSSRTITAVLSNLDSLPCENEVALMIDLYWSDP